MKDVTPAHHSGAVVFPPPAEPTSELGRELLGAWQRLDALGQTPLTLDDLQREVLEDAA